VTGFDGIRIKRQLEILPLKLLAFFDVGSNPARREYILTLWKLRLSTEVTLWKRFEGKGGLRKTAATALNCVWERVSGEFFGVQLTLKHCMTPLL